MIYLWRDTLAGCWVVNYGGAEVAHLPDVLSGVNAAVELADQHQTLAFLMKDDGRWETLNTRVWNGEGGL